MAERTPEFAHIGLTHTNGDQCIWLDGYWFVPLDVGGEGYACPHDHPFMAQARTEGFDQTHRDRGADRMTDLCFDRNPGAFWMTCGLDADHDGEHRFSDAAGAGAWANDEEEAS